MTIKKTKVEMIQQTHFVFLFIYMWAHLGVSFSVSPLWRSVVLGESHQL